MPDPPFLTDVLSRRPHRTMPRVLIAEDDRELRTLLQITLRREGLSVSEARDGNELLEIARATRREDGSAPELVLTDVRMPGLTGLEALRALREILTDSVVVVMTAYGDEALLREAREAGAFAVLQKPFELDQLRSLVRTLFGR